MELLDVGALLSGRIAMNAGYADAWLADNATAQDYQTPVFAELWPKIRGRTLLDPFRADAIIGRLAAVVHLEGDVIECGAFRGGISLLMALALRKLGVPKRVLILDSFEGLPAPVDGRDHGYCQGDFRAEQAALEAAIADLDLGDVCEIHPGWFEDTLPAATANRRFAFAHIDGDLYHSTRTCLRQLHPAMPDGAPLVLDDYSDGSGGVMLAVNSFAAGTGEVIHLGPAPQATIIKGQTGSPDDAALIHPSRAISISAASLAAYPLYGRFLEHVRGLHAGRLADFDRFVALCRDGAATDLAAPDHARWLQAVFGG